jgi:hypothetical protein
MARAERSDASDEADDLEAPLARRSPRREVIGGSIRNLVAGSSARLRL